MIFRSYLVTLDGSLSCDRMDLGTCVLSGPRPFGPPKDTGRFRPWVAGKGTEGGCSPSWGSWCRQVAGERQSILELTFP